MADAQTIANALRLARGCVEDARTLAATGSRNAAYLCEQAPERLIRAVATSEGLHIERQDAHQLDKVVRRFPASNVEKAALLSLTWLEAYATTFRYTLPSGGIPKSPDPARLDAAIMSIQDMIHRVSARFEVDLEKLNSPAGTTAPLR